MPSLRKAAVFAAALLSSANAVAIPHPDLDLEPTANATHSTHLFKRRLPDELPQCATAADKKWQPAMDFDRDGCYNSVAIGPDLFLNEGLNPCNGGGESGCRDRVNLDRSNNVYSRARCNGEWCAYMYAYYFEKDKGTVGCNTPSSGHRHDWEHVVVWVRGDRAEYVAASAHGSWSIRRHADVHWHDGTHPKIVYHKDGVGTHALRFASGGDDNIENHYGQWFFGRLVGYFGFPSAAVRDKMLLADWGSASVGIRDKNFKKHLDGAKKGKNIKFDSGRDEGPNSPGDPVGC